MYNNKAQKNEREGVGIRSGLGDKGRKAEKMLQIQSEEESENDRTSFLRDQTRPPTL